MDLLHISEFLKNSIRYILQKFHNLIKHVFDWQLVEAVLKQTQNISENTNPNFVRSLNILIVMFN